jgi:hypothetical protein
MTTGSKVRGFFMLAVPEIFNRRPFDIATNPEKVALKRR